MRERVLSAAVIVPVVAIVFLLGMPWLALGLAILAVLAALEVMRLLARTGLRVAPLPAVAVAPIAVLGITWEGLSAGWVAVFIAASVIVLAIDAFRRPAVEDGFRAWLGGSFGAVYPALLAFTAGILVIAPPPESEPLLGDALDPGRTWLLVLVLTVWAFDTFAYLSGRTFKRGRFLNHISPNKTWSGVIGGTVAAIVVAGALTWAAGQWWPGGLVMGFVLAVAAQSGDVAESMLKRTAGAKDSGSLIPGHGGILDRVDSFLFAAPVVFAYLLVIGGT
jgi:phosphatidate cytidylyltransferase